MNSLNQNKFPFNYNNKKPKYRCLFSYSGLGLTSFYIFLVNNVARSEQQNFRGNNGGCIISCFDGFMTSILVAPSLILGSLFDMREFDFRDWNQLRIYIGFTALLVYIVGTALEKLSCYLISLFIRSKAATNKARH